MTKLERILITKTPVAFILRKSQHWYLPGFEGVPLYDVVMFFTRQMSKVGINDRAAAISFNFLMAIPAGTIFLCTLIPYMPISTEITIELLDLAKMFTPDENTYGMIANFLNDFLNTPRSGLLSFGFVVAVFYASNAVMALMRSFNRSLHSYKERGFVNERWTAIKLTFMVLIVSIFTLTALILQTAYINELIERYIGYGVLIQVLSLVIIILMIFLTMCMVYTYGPSLTERFPFFSPGAVIATVLCVLLSAVFFFLVRNVIHYNKVYGSIGTLMAFMVWVFLNTQVILLGYEINVSILLCRLRRDKGLPNAQQAELF